MGYRFSFDKEKCVGCYACHMACLDAHHTSDEEKAKSHRRIVRMVQPDFEKNVCPGCNHCGLCVEHCPHDAIFRDEDTSVVLIDSNRCVGCGFCLTVCPNHMIHLSQSEKAEKCDGCMARLREGKEPACVRVCCMHAITIEQI